jgi:NAD(P)-dependent dehydrogenase (short-subunit alcohol dehydrogenase family)
MTGKVVLLTGATRGIGRACARAVASTGATLVVVGRSQERLDSLLSELRTVAGCGEVSGLLADLAIQSEIHTLADEFKSKHDRLDVLINNAGGIFSSLEKSSDDIEYTFALNHNGYYLLTTLLQDLLRASAPARIISTASAAHGMGKMVFDDLQYDNRRYGSGWSSYCQSKLANILFTRELSHRLEGTGVTANCIHPGFVNTGFGKNNGALMRFSMLISRPVQRNPTRGAESLVWGALSKEAEGVTGKYLYNCKAKKPTRRARNDEDAARLWEITEKMTDTVAAWSPNSDVS